MRLFVLVIAMVPATILSYGQTATLEDKTAFAGDNVSVALNVSGFSGVNAITLSIRYNPAVVSFISVSNPSPQLTGGSLTANAQDSTITIAWFSVTPATINGQLCKLNFGYHGTASNLVFLPSSIVTQGAGTNLTVGYFNGSVSPAPCSSGTPHASIGSNTCVPGSQVTVPLTFTNFPLTGAITQVIHYDPAKLTFVSATKSGALAGANVFGAAGEITIAWSNPAGALINTTGSTYINLNFMSVLPGNSILAFAPGCLFSTPAAVNIPACFSNGTITQAPTTETAILGSLTGIAQGDNIKIPLDLNISQPVSSFTLYLSFNSPLIALTGIETVDPLSSLVTTNVTPSTLTLVYTNPAAPVIAPGTFLRLKFKYNGIGTGHVNFSGACEFSNNAFPLPQPINVAYTNATVAPGTYPPIATATIGSVSGNVGNFVDVPVIIDGATSNPIYAATMFIGYDPAKLAFVSAVGNTHNAIVNSVGANQISIAWDDPAGATLNGTFLSLRYQYQGGAGLGCASDIYFKNDVLTQQPCELAGALGAFAPANWINGGVNISPAAPAINGPANPGAFTVVTYTTDAGMLNYNWTATGGTIATPTASSVAVTWGAAGAGSLAVSYTTPGGCNLSSTKPVTIVNGSPVTDVDGFVTYDNVSSQGMNGVNVTLINSIGVPVGSQTTGNYSNGSHGYYHFTGVPQDDYTMSVSLSAPWAGIAGVTALDALLVELHTAGVLNPPLTGLNLSAGNVNNVMPVNATDALLIKQRIIGDITSFPAGDWVFGNGTVHAFPGPLTSYSFKGLCTGDVNGSYNPVVGVKSGPVVSVIEDGVQPVAVNSTFTYDLRSAVAANLGAMTLFLGYDPSVVEIVKVNTSIAGMEYSVRNGIVSIAWSNPDARVLTADGAVLSLQVRILKEIQEPSQVFTVMTGSEFADAGTEVLHGFELKLANVVTNSPAFSALTCPNPFHHTANVVYSMPASGQVRIIVSNIVGNTVCTLFDGTQKAGTHSVAFDPSVYNLTPGIYLCNVEVVTSTDTYVRTTKLIYTR